MAKFRIDSLADLSRQLAFSPHEARGAQVAAAEELLHIIDPATAYPLDFIIFRITGYHPKQVAEDLLTGLALQHDLGLLVEQVSDTLDVRTEQLAEPVLSIDDVTAKFNVTSKTIQRWRRKGLPARKFLFPDGKRRVGFLLGSVDRFFAAHREQVTKGANFSQLSEAERRDILSRARRLAGKCRCCPHEISRRIARKTGRSPLTVQHTIRKHDEENPGRAIFPLAPPTIPEDDRAALLKAYRRGQPIGALARSAGRTRAAVARVVVEERVGRLNRKKIRFIDDPLYHGEGAESAVEGIASQEELAADPRREEGRIPRDLPPYLQDLYRTPLLSPARERALFLKYNFQKFQFVSARRRLDPQFAKKRDLTLLETLLRRATETKNDIVRANLRLVVSIARKHLRPGRSWNANGPSEAVAGDPTLMELVSEGNLTLMRAVESFDLHKGYRFSTYATLALMKGFARSVPLMRAGLLSGRKGAASVQRLRGDVRLLADVADPRGGATGDRLVQREEVSALLARLDDRERQVLVAHFGLSPHEGATAPCTASPRASRLNAEEPMSEQTYEQVGRRLGLSKQRVRQIEQSALAKLRALVTTPTLT